MFWPVFDCRILHTERTHRNTHAFGEPHRRIHCSKSDEEKIKFSNKYSDEEKIKFSNKYIEYLYENIGNYPFGAEKMAEHFGITSQYLRRQFRKETDSP